MDYDSKTDKFVGFTLPIKEDGLPDKKKFENLTASQLKVHFMQSPQSCYIYTIMVKPLSLKSSSFCLAVFGTDNKFKMKDVLHRNEKILNVLRDEGIEVLGMSSDGDSRLLKYMKLISKIGDKTDDQKLNVPEEFKKYVYCDLDPIFFPFQDTLHIVTKLRNAVAKFSANMKINTYAISHAYLINLVKNHPRGEHNLSMTDVKVKDRMNVTSAVKLFQEDVTDLLTSKEERGLLFYLKIMKFIHEPFAIPSLSPQEVIHKIWFAALALRAWRCHDGTATFISSNAYVCVQINAHMILALYRKLRDKNQLQYFLPSLYNSQTCESFFRLARSFTTTQSTVINFSVYQFLHRLKRIQVAEDLQAKFSKGKYSLKN